MRHTGTYVVELGSGHWKGWGELRKDEGEEECRGEERINK